jgi:altronate dehydratase
MVVLRARDSLDFYSGQVVEGVKSIDEAGDDLLRVVIDIASGALTKGETVNYSEPIDIYGSDPIF